MKDFLPLGPTPSKEPCAQVGSPNYHQRARQECKRYIGLLRETFGPEPEGARLSTKIFSLAFTPYYEVVINYDDSSEEATNYAFRLKAAAPATWS